MGKIVDCDTNVLWDKRKKEAKRNACRCNSWFGFNESIRMACVNAMQFEPRPLDKDDFICNYFGAETYATYVGLMPTCKGFNIKEDTLQGKLNTEKESSSFILWVIIGLIFIISAIIAKITWKH